MSRNPWRDQVAAARKGPARCVPADANACRLRLECARHHHTQAAPKIDASVSIRVLGFCPMFVSRAHVLGAA